MIRDIGQIPVLLCFLGLSVCGCVGSQRISHVGESCLDNSDCGSGEYCRKPDGACDAPGQCAARPEACTLEFAPVCGCDGETYSNDCHAAAAGVNVAHVGPCGNPE